MRCVYTTALAVAITVVVAPVVLITYLTRTVLP